MDNNPRCHMHLWCRFCIMYIVSSFLSVSYLQLYFREVASRTGGGRLALFKHMNEQWCEHLNTGAGGTELLLVNIFVFSPPCDPYVFVFIHMNVFVSPCEYICVFAAGIPASLIHIPGSQPVVIPPSVDMSEFVDFSPLPRTHTFQDGRPKLLSYHMSEESPKSVKVIYDCQTVSRLG